MPVKVTVKARAAMQAVIDRLVCMLNLKTGVECWVMLDEVPALVVTGNWQVQTLPHPLTVSFN